MPDYANHTWTRAELLRHVGQMDQLAGIRPRVTSDGPGRGVRTLHVYTGSGLEFEVVADRALDIAACHFQGRALAWQAPVGVVHPAHYEATGLGWLRTFGGGLLATCGLDHFGPPTSDGDEQFGLHGRIGTIPAQQVNYRCAWEGDRYLLEISGQVRQARLFGENLLLERCIRTELGSARIEVEDTVTNEGFDSQPHMVLYHCNFGFPLIAAETELIVEGAETVARDDVAKAGLADWPRFQPPTPGYREQVFRHQVQPDATGWAQATVVSPTAGLTLRLAFDAEHLPYLFQWKQMGAGAYVLGLEPANCSSIAGRTAARAQNELPHLEPGEMRAYRLSIEVERTE